ncbi:phosphate/phosphite/phosphonate ABC transporter substrate-binding protein [Alteromonas sp. C1M14]|uniref:phosphate/phosphite/phosphonate ABC transporter substrate-binding protein n=1 Tax=Alteromonas sp. C1M14 TaxID=2841567 RepID=UPI001C0A321F|nr:phosphate/phosphite/phosphonate ABC transporter substrate-binding protein [Alteromonas sp. C1M14]MBU2978273.1 phosphate/phosphite/phosphonate ABC transporter substrate-binding protein [Alteromonas sp. C1M14]
MKAKLIYLCACWFLTFGTPVVSETYTVGIVPQQSPKKLAQAWQPLINYLSTITGHEWRFETAKDIPAFEKALANGEYDLAYMNPYHLVVFSEAAGYRAIARQKEKYIQGIIVVNKTSNVNTLADLNGADIAFPAPAAFAASIIPQAKLRQEGIQFNPVYVHSHDSVYLNVHRAFFVAGGGIYRTLNVAPKAVNKDLNVLWESPPFTPHALAVHPKLKPALATKLQNALLQLARTDSVGKEILTGLKMKGFVLAKNEDWNDVRALNINLLSSVGE